MNDEKFYFYKYYTFLGRISYGKTRGEPITKSVNGGGKQRIISKVEITEEQFDNVNLVELQRVFYPDEVNHGR